MVYHIVSLAPNQVVRTLVVQNIEWHFYRQACHLPSVIQRLARRNQYIKQSHINTVPHKTYLFFIVIQSQPRDLKRYIFRPSHNRRHFLPNQNTVVLTHCLFYLFLYSYYILYLKSFNNMRLQRVDSIGIKGLRILSQPASGVVSSYDRCIVMRFC